MNPYLLIFLKKVLKIKFSLKIGRKKDFVTLHCMDLSLLAPSLFEWSTLKDLRA